MALSEIGAAVSSKWKENFNPRQHNLFLSYASEDKTFVRMLHENLKKCHHSPFLDQERDSLPVGTYFPSAILNAVSKCQVIVFVLSEHFVTKKWPMLELLEAWKLPSDKRPIMFPIFYKLDVGKINETNLKEWCNCWSKLVKNNNNMVFAFKKALQGLTKYSGVCRSEGVDDYKFAKSVVLEICRQVTPNKFWVNDAMQKKDELCKHVCDLMLSEGVKGWILGMWGSTGSGKTSIAMAVCHRLYKEYGGSVAHVDCSRFKDNLQMARALYLSLKGEKLGKRVDNEYKATNSLSEFVKDQKRLFVVLDELPLTEDGKGIAEYALDILKHCKECKVLLTAQNETFLNSLLEPYRYESCVTKVPHLDEEAAANILLGLACPTRKWNDLTREEKEAIREVFNLLPKLGVYSNPRFIKILGVYISSSDRKSNDPTLWPTLITRDVPKMKEDLHSKLFALVNEQFQTMTASHLQAFYIDAALYDVAIETRLRGICGWLSVIHGCQPETTLRKLKEVASNGPLEWEGWKNSNAELDDSNDDKKDPEIITDNMFAKFAKRQVLENPEKWGWFFYSGIAHAKEAESEMASEDENTSNQFAPVPRPANVKKIEKIALVGSNFQDVGEVLNLTLYTKAVAMVVSRCNKVEELNVEWNTLLKVLEVEECEKLELIEGLEDLTSLVCLRVVLAPISKVELRCNKLGHLQKLEIRDTEMSKPPDLRGCFKLRELILANNELQSLPECWTGFSCLTKLSFAGNQGIIALPDLSPLASVLRNLNISHCKKLAHADCIPSLTSLETLYLNDCSTLRLRPSDLQPLKNLRHTSTVPDGLLPETEEAWFSIFCNIEESDETLDWCSVFHREEYNKEDDDENSVQIDDDEDEEEKDHDEQNAVPFWGS